MKAQRRAQRVTLQRDPTQRAIPLRLVPPPADAGSTIEQALRDTGNAVEPSDVP